MEQSNSPYNMGSIIKNIERLKEGNKSRTAELKGMLKSGKKRRGEIEKMLNKHK